MAGRKLRDYSFLSGYSFYVPGLRGTVSLILMFLVGSLLGSAVTVALTQSLGQDFTSQYGLLIAYPLSFAPAMMYASLKSKRNALFEGGRALDSSNFSPLGGALCAVMVITATIAASYMCDAIMAGMPDMPVWLEDALAQATQGKLWVNIMCVSVMAPVCEEWLCRGMILRGLLNRERRDGGKGYGPSFSIVFSAFIFALIHMNPWQAIPAFILGCLFGYIYYRTGSLKLTMLMHCANNTFSVLMSRVDAFEDADTWLDVLGPAAYWAVWAACALTVVAVLRQFSKAGEDKFNGNCDEVVADIRMGDGK